MRLQEQLSRRVKGKTYPKYVIAIPPKKVEKLGWQKGIELEAYIEDNKLVLKPKEENKENVRLIVVAV